MKVNHTLNAEMLAIMQSVKDVFEAMEKINTPTLQLVAPSYYLLIRKLQLKPPESSTTSLFRAKLRKYLHEKYWSSISALHWTACFLDPSFKHLQFIPSSRRDDVKFKRGLMEDLDAWVLDEMGRVEELLTARTDTATATATGKCFQLQCHIYIA